MDEIIYLIENAEQGSDLETVESGQKARAELNALLARLQNAEKSQAIDLDDVLKIMQEIIDSPEDDGWDAIIELRTRLMDAVRESRETK